MDMLEIQTKDFENIKGKLKIPKKRRESTSSLTSKHKVIHWLNSDNQLILNQNQQRR